MSKELFQEAEGLWDRAEKAYKFQTRFNTYPFKEGQRLVDEFNGLGDSIKVDKGPTTPEEVYDAELKRRLSSEALWLEHLLSGHSYTFEDVINLYGIDIEDVNRLRSWLVENRDGALEAIDRVYVATDVEHFRLPIPLDIPRHRRQGEEFAATNIEIYHKNIASLFSQLTEAGSFLRDITSVPTSEERSYFNPTTKTLALGIPAICYITENQSLYINERELIRLFGHEGMGHGLNKVITEQSDLPGFLKRQSEATRATIESVGQFYEQIIFDALAASSSTQKDLQIEHKFEEIYQEEKDTKLVNQYQRTLSQYAVAVLADRELGDISNLETRRAAIDRRIELLSDVSLYPGYAVWFIESNQYNFDSKGNLNFQLVSEMLYCARPAERVIDVMRNRSVNYEGEGRSKIDMLLLRGFWTPIGLVENAKSSEV